MKRIENVETKNAENIRIELTISEKKRDIFLTYCQPSYNKAYELSGSPSVIFNKYDNIILADINTDIVRPNTDSLNYLSGLSDVSNQTNLVKNATCFKSKNKETLVNVMLTNKPKCFFKSHNFVLALSDFHKLTVSILRVQKPSKTFLKSYYLLENENFNQDAFLHDLDSRLIQGKLYGDLLIRTSGRPRNPF